MKQIDILIVDDEIKFAGILSKRLALRGIVSDICHDGNSGLEWIKKASGSRPLVLLDLNLPDIYGVQVLMEIKKIDPAIPVVIVTGHGTETDREECLRLGAQDFTNKPVKIDEIIDLLKCIKEGKALQQ